MRRSLTVLLGVITSGVVAVTPHYGQPANTAITIRSDVQEANARTGVITARGNVRIDYPARQLVGTAAQAQYFTDEQKIVLSGNVVVTERGVNTIRAETITYLVNEGQFVALPPTNQQVESVYILPDRGIAAAPATTATPIEQIKPPFKSPVAPPHELESARSAE
ncbi:MAG: LptA/OstA family protein [Pseudanabaenaceae cyanobacterium]